MLEFQAWPKTPRLFDSEMVVTEKIDGTNAAIIIEEQGAVKYEDGIRFPDKSISSVGHFVGAQSRKRIIDPEVDNFGFARWVFDNAEQLVTILGPGRHFGEWWGSGIQRGYGLTKGEKIFSLFNVSRYGPILHAWTESHLVGPLNNQLRVVPTLAEGPFDLHDIRYILGDLKKHGSWAAPGFDRPEGVVVYHVRAGQTFKAFVQGENELPKSQQPGFIGGQIPPGAVEIHINTALSPQAASDDAIRQVLGRLGGPGAGAQRA
jgi:hypothetical protein